MPRQKSTATDPWAALDAIVKREEEPTGPEWFTVDQFAERYKMSDSRARFRCDQMYRKGQLKRWQGIGSGSKRMMNKYCLA